jgi:hypothetical protein
MNQIVNMNISDAVEVEVLPAAKPKGWAKEKKARQRKSMKERIEGIIAKDEAKSRKIGEAIIKSTGQLCYDFPWQSAAPRPWRDGYTRVLIPLKTPTRKGRHCLVQIVRNSNLSHGKHS